MTAKTNKTTKIIEIGTRFTMDGSRYDKRVWRVIRIEDDVLPISGRIIRYVCNAEGTNDFYYMAPERIPEIHIIKQIQEKV